MSSMLEQAIIEAEELKRVATRNAEQAILEKYSREIKEEMESLLEQDLGLGGDDTTGGLDLGGTSAKPQVDFENAKKDKDHVPGQLEYAAFDGLTIGETKYPSESDLIEINLDSLSEYELNPDKGPTARNLSESIEIDDSFLFEIMDDGEELELVEEDDEILDEEALIGKGPVKPEKSGKPKKKTMCEECGKMHEGNCGVDESGVSQGYKPTMAEEDLLELDDDVLAEMIKVDYRSVKEGNPFGSTNERDEMNLILADLKQQCEDLNMKNESLKKANKRVVKESLEYKKHFESAERKSKDLSNKYASLLEKFQELRGAFEESQMMNAKLVYTNKVLSDDKLNVRQKDKIAESIRSSNSVTEAKIVYETLINAVESTSKKGPESLSEAVTRRANPLFIKERTEVKPSNDFASRMKRLAGIDN